MMILGNGGRDDDSARARTPTVLAGADRSDEALDGLALAAALASALNARLIVGAAVEHEPIASPDEGYRESRQRYLNEVEARVSRALGDLDFEWRPIQDTASHGLAELARAEGADLVAVGPTHRGAVGRVLPGSVGESLLHGAPCAVAVAPRGYRERRTGSPRAVGVAFDDSAEAWEALRFGSALARASDARLELLTVALSMDDGGYWSPQLNMLQEQEETAKRRALDLALSTTNGLPVDGLLLHGDPATMLVRASEDLDLLCLGSRGYGPVRRVFPGSVAAKVARGAHCAVVVTPRGAGSDRLWAEELATASTSSG